MKPADEPLSPSSLTCAGAEPGATGALNAYLPSKSGVLKMPNYLNHWAEPGTASRRSPDKHLSMAGTNAPNDRPAVETPEDERLPPVPDARYGTFDVPDGTTVLFDREADDAWLRADCVMEVGP